MVDSEVAGVSFTVNPATNNADQIIIEWGFGLWEAVVSGIITPDSYVWSKSKQEILEKNINSQTKKLIVDIDRWGIKEEEIETPMQSFQKLSNQQIIKLALISEKIEKYYWKSMDIEWAIEDGEFYILQARPVTTIPVQNTKLTELYSTQISLTERLSNVEGFDAQAFRKADVSKRDRLDFLHRYIWLPYQKPLTFTYDDVLHNSNVYKDYTSTYEWKIAVRFASSDSNNKKHRTRGILIQDLQNWLESKEVSDTSTYTVQIIVNKSEI